MVTFTILLIALLVLAIAATLAIILGGAGFIVIFGDLIVCGLIIWLIVRLFRRKK